MPNKLPFVTILETPICTLTTKELVSDIIENLIPTEKNQICITPVNNVVWAAKNQQLNQLYKSARCCVADGVPLIWASKILGNPISQRTAGHDLVLKLCEAIQQTQYSIFFMGGAPGVAELAATNLKTTYKGLNIAGFYSPPFKKTFTKTENYEMIQRVNASGANILMIAMTSPKQDLWIHENLDKLDVNLAIGIGAALDYAAGTFKRPPKWIQNSGFEWFFRFLKEPKRLFRRYIIEAPIFIPLLLRQIYRMKY